MKPGKMVFLLTNGGKMFRKRKKSSSKNSPVGKSAEELQKMIHVIEAVHSDEETRKQTETLAASKSDESNATPTPVGPPVEEERSKAVQMLSEKLQQQNENVTIEEKARVDTTEQRQDADEDDHVPTPTTVDTTAAVPSPPASDMGAHSVVGSVAAAAAATAAYQATAKATTTPTATTATSAQSPSSSSPWAGLWQRCVGDCCGAVSPRGGGLEHVVVSDEDDLVDNGNLLELEASDAEEEQEAGFRIRLPSMMHCVDDEVLELVVPPLCERLESGSPKARTAALQRLMQLTDRERSYHRIPMVCTPHWDIISAICGCLQSPTITVKDRRTCLLLLSNLTMPADNKAVLLLGEDNPRRQQLLQTLWDLLYNPKGETHLVCAVLMNLAALRDEEGVARLIRFVPTMSEEDEGEEMQLPAEKQEQQPASVEQDTLSYYKDDDCLENNKSLLRTLELLMITYKPFVAPEHGTPANAGPFVMNSMERESMRWTFGMIRNAVATHIDLAKLVGQTQIPLVALQVLRDTPQRDVALWKTHGQSLEDTCLALLVEIALQEARLAVSQADDDEEESSHRVNPKLHVAPSLYDISCREYLRHIMGKGCIHDVRASAVVCQYDPGCSALEGELAGKASF